jgi:predicted hydrocarbon binding protein
MTSLKKSSTVFVIWQDGACLQSGSHQFALGSDQGEELARMIALEVVENYLTAHGWEIAEGHIIESEHFADDSIQVVISVTCLDEPEFQESELFTVNLQ